MSGGQKAGQKNLFLQYFLEYILLMVGGLFVGISVGLVMLPAKLTTGGFSGIATILYYFFQLPANIGIIILNIPVFLLTWKVLGFRYGFRSLIGLIMCSLGINLGDFILTHLGPLTNDLILSAIYGGAISGIGIALTYRASGSTGGTDLIAKLVHHFKPYMNMGEILLMVDGITILILAITFKSVEIALYSIVAVFVATKIVDFVLEGASFAKAVFIITNKSEEISEFIHASLDRTATKINAVGTFTNSEKDILLCVVNKKEIPKLKEYIQQVDENAFTIVTTVTEAIGEGFY